MDVSVSRSMTATRAIIHIRFIDYRTTHGEEGCLICKRVSSGSQSVLNSDCACSGDEDYRWAVLRKRIPVWLFHIVNLTFIGTFHGRVVFTLLMKSTMNSRYSECYPVPPGHPNIHRCLATPPSTQRLRLFPWRICSHCARHRIHSR